MWWFAFIVSCSLIFFITSGFERTEIGVLERNIMFNSGIFVSDSEKRLSVSPLVIENTRSVIACSWRCIQNFKCHSFNFAVKKVQELFKCELLETDKYNSSGDFRESLEYHHYRVESQCEHASCLNGGTCQHVYEIGGHLCRCPVGFNGTNCEWKKVNTNQVCFSARGNQHGVFNVPNAGQIKAFKLVHLSGRVAGYGAGTNWGTNPTRFDTIITNAMNQVISPPLSMLDPTWYIYTLPGVSASDPELILPELNPPLAVAAGQEFRVWFSEDLKDATEGDNSGTTCADVFVNYQQ